MRMLFILQLAHADYERGLRGVQRLLCTLLRTRSDSHNKRVRAADAGAHMYHDQISQLR
jgi:hypothetical protein